jgi:CO/xanthine dehydrogenase FAD-binding subunit
LPSGTIVLAVSFPRPTTDTFRFLKVSRVKPKGAAVLSLAAVIELGDERVTRARVALGAMAEAPMRAKAFEAALQGQRLAPETIEAALPAALEGVAPASDAISSAWYRRAVLPVHLRRLLATPSH